MQGNESSNKALNSTYVRIQNNELHQAMETGSVPRKLTGRVKKLKQSYEPVYLILDFPVCYINSKK